MTSNAESLLVTISRVSIVSVSFILTLFAGQTYVGRDMKLDSLEICLMAAARSQSVIDPTKTLNNAQHEEMARILVVIYKELYGPNYTALYPKASGSVHSKIAIAKYEGFIRIMSTSYACTTGLRADARRSAVTSANMMKLDIELCSNVSCRPHLHLPQMRKLMLTAMLHLR